MAPAASECDPGRDGSTGARALSRPACALIGGVGPGQWEDRVGHQPSTPVPGLPAPPGRTWQTAPSGASHRGGRRSRWSGPMGSAPPAERGFSPTGRGAGTRRRALDPAGRGVVCAPGDLDALCPGCGVAQRPDAGPEESKRVCGERPKRPEPSGSGFKPSR